MSSKYSVGIGLTNDCNLHCAHCYRDTNRVDHVSLVQVKTICDSIPVGSMGFGTGENALHPEFIQIVEYLHGQGVKLSVASNGHTLTVLPDHVLKQFHDVEVSIDYATEEEQDTFRGAGNWALVHEAIKRCQRLGIGVSILATLMRTNFDQMDRLVELARANDTYLRVNAYQPVKTDAYRLTYEEFWEGYQRLFADGLVISCTEPVVRAVMGLDNIQSPCGRQSIRFNPRGQIIPCVYWPANGMLRPDITDLPQLGEAILDTPDFQRARREPDTLKGCACHGGCASRRALNRELDAHDDYCPWVRGDNIVLDWKPAPSVDLMRSGNVCTTVVM